ncbi:MAG: NADH-dependent [FeFe] hydrogenase, group A6 [Caldisericum sp.]|uniref:NADH-dependent [FeFe] hydrogenase, group A6 n=1 Tax=Caldisericum sp. TaxID=2499687 RepID=UPI003D0C1D31
MSELVNVKIDGKPYQFEKGTTILKACKSIGIEIPTLCYLEGIAEEGVCGVCVVEVKGSRTLQRSCITEVLEGMEIYTNSPLVRTARKINLELALAHHDVSCPTCVRNDNCELQTVSNKLGVKEVTFPQIESFYEKDLGGPVVRDPSKCIFCRRCVSVCENIQNVNALTVAKRGIKTYIGAPFDLKLVDSPCVNCGQCIMNCPTGALSERDDTEKVWEALSDPDKYVVVSTAPAIRASLGELFDLPPGTFVRGKVATALRLLGFKQIFDTNFTADLTIVEEAHELIERVKNNGVLPMTTSCCPGWIKYLEEYYPEFIPNVSTCKSPQQMMGAIIKSYFSEKTGIPKEKIFHVSIMPCTAKKYEAERLEINASQVKDVDVVLTTREIARMIKEAGIDFVNLEDSDYDLPLGEYTGAATIFGATGGVMEAALRTAYEMVTGETLESVDFIPLRGLEGIKVSDVDIDGVKIRVAVAHTLGNASKLLEKVKSGEEKVHFIEVMACPGGCIGGGGQPIPTTDEIRLKRIQALYKDDSERQLRKSHENPYIKKLYAEYLGEIGGEKAHHLLHTHYIPRSPWERAEKIELNK